MIKRGLFTKVRDLRAKAFAADDKARALRLRLQRAEAEAAQRHAEANRWGDKLAKRDAGRDMRGQS